MQTKFSYQYNLDIATINSSVSSIHMTAVAPHHFINLKTMNIHLALLVTENEWLLGNYTTIVHISQYTYTNNQ